MPATLTREDVFRLIREDMPRLQRDFGVERLALYGSFAKGSQSKSSDVDIIVQLARPLGLQFVALAYHLEELLGRKVDLATFASMAKSAENPRYRHIADDVQRTLHYV